MSDLNQGDFNMEYTVRTLNNRDSLKRNYLGFAFCIGFLLGYTNLALAGNEEDHHKSKNDGPDGFTYAVHVKSSFGTKFDDCFAFDPNSPGTVRIQRLFGQLPYAHDDLNKDEEDWQSTSSGDSVFGIAFHGSTDNHGKKIEGDAINDSGDTFVFKGKRVQKCEVDNLEVDNLRAQDINPYRQ